jgi:hypothetical protein
MTPRRSIATALVALGLASLACASVPRAARAAAAVPERARRLEDVYIEGEIPVPQVLFVTGRDQKRFLVFQHRRFLEASLQASRKVAATSGVRVVGNRPNSGRKDAAR